MIEFEDRWGRTCYVNPRFVSGVSPIVKNRDTNKYEFALWWGHEDGSITSKPFDTEDDAWMAQQLFIKECEDKR